MDLISSILLGVLQGLTEWLPVSSSGHLALAQHYFGVSAPIAFDVLLHFGTLLAVIAYFRKDLYEMTSNALTGKIAYPSYLLLAMIPTALVGFSLKGYFESMFSQPLLVACALVITGAFLYASQWLSSGKRSLTARSSLLIGLAQGFAVAPGISRSGATISAGLLAGLNRREAARFSFLLSIPAVLGATAIEGTKALSFTGLSIEVIAAGVIASALVGYACIGLLLRFIEQGKLHYFSAYCFALAALVFAVEVL